MRFNGTLLLFLLIFGWSRGDFMFEPDIQGKITKKLIALPASCKCKPAFIDNLPQIFLKVMITTLSHLVTSLCTIIMFVKVGLTI